VRSWHISTISLFAQSAWGLIPTRGLLKDDLMETRILKAATTVLLENFFCFSHQDKSLTKWLVNSLGHNLICF
jgi:hypothetical protein